MARHRHIGTGRTSAGFSVADLIIAALSLTSCADHATLSVAAGTGPFPQLPAQKITPLPTLKIAPARGWPSGGAPIAGKGQSVTAIAEGLEHPRWLYVLPNDDILVAETNAPPKPDDSKGIKGWITKLVMKRAGAVTPSANRISLLRSHAGRETYDRYILVEGLNSPFGMVLVGDQLYVADSDALVRFPFHIGETRIDGPGLKVADLPAGPINHHWTKNVIVSPDGKTLYVSVGSNSNAGENGIAAEVGRAAIWAVNPKTGNHRIFASGLRNPVGMGIQPWTGALWVAVNERDELGSDLVPDYMTGVREGAFYGWPYSYYGQNVDPRPQPPRPDLVAKAIAPDYALGPHTASLGLAFGAHGVFIGQHGSWNRNPPSGYKVIFVPFGRGHPTGRPKDVLTGFLDEYGNAQGRPVGVALDRRGALLVADDVGNKVWRVSPALPAGK
ncbi:PQQ-dependent sugar dehydrogenase [Labrys miyagiensis]|uniref:PQQ-dependent sugar dehydrogenase n=1 Tax=Labrys miyagiensis TaxID=346912 RepID=UPI0024E172AA|nr:sorbosone dehydrogenase family protein [Labrys miyagiensis]